MSDLASAPVPGFEVCGVRVDAHQIPSATATILDWGREHQGRAVHLVNAGTLSLAARDQRLRDLLARGDLNLADGMPLVWIARLLGFGHMRDRVYGPDLMLDVLEAGLASGVRHYLYGSTPEVIERLAVSLTARFPGLQLAGVESPPFRPLTPAEEEELVERVRRSRADIVWIGLGTPLQDVFVDRFRNRLGASLVAVGAAFDFHSGAKRQAPRPVRRLGLEWLWRLASEPRRLWRRYLIGNTVFLADLARRRPRVLPPRLAR